MASKPALESALVIELDRTIKWSSALQETTGTLSPVDPVATFDCLDYAKRDRELLYRDLITAAAVVRVATEIDEIWATDEGDVVKPTMQGEPLTFQLPYYGSVARSVDGTVQHVDNSDIPFTAAEVTDRDLYGRDALVFQTLAGAVHDTLIDPPITRIDTTGTQIPPRTAWSHASGSNIPADINASLPMNVPTFRRPDEWAAYRDNQNAAYVSRLAQVLKNPFAFANRLFVKTEGADIREAEIYTFTRQYYVTGTTYAAGAQVYYLTGWYEARVSTTALPTVATDWMSISGPTERVFTIQPALEGRNKIVYNTSTNTLQWFREVSSPVHVPQIFALSIPGIVPGQTVDTVPQVPSAKDSQFYRQKASHLSYAGPVYSDVGYLRSTSQTSTVGGVAQIKNASEGGLDQANCASLTIPGNLKLTFADTSLPAGDYKVSLLVKPEPVVELQGGQNAIGASGTLGGVTYASTGSTIPYTLSLPEGAWNMVAEYTNLSGSATSFGVRATLDGQPILLDTVGLPFVDVDGNSLTNGDLVQSSPIALTANGNQQTLNITWTYGNGQFHIRELTFTSTENKTGRFHMSGSLVSSTSGTAELDVIGQRYIPEVMPFIFTTSGSIYEPQLTLDWIEDGKLPLLVCQAQIESVGTTSGTPNALGFEGFKYDMLERALRSCVDNYKEAIVDRQSGTVGIPVFRDEDTNKWSANSTDEWMRFLEVYEPRLRQQENVVSGGIVQDRQYRVSGTSGDVVYNGTSYAIDATFYGGGTTVYTSTGNAQVDQIGAFKAAKPGYVGRPALVPYGLTFTDSGTAQMPYTSNVSVPTLQTCQPWMVETGIYVADHDFWSPTQL